MVDRQGPQLLRSPSASAVSKLHTAGWPLMGHHLHPAQRTRWNVCWPAGPLRCIGSAMNVRVRSSFTNTSVPFSVSVHLQRTKWRKRQGARQAGRQCHALSSLICLTSRLCAKRPSSAVTWRSYPEVPKCTFSTAHTHRSHDASCSASSWSSVGTK